MLELERILFRADPKLNPVIRLPLTFYLAQNSTSRIRRGLINNYQLIC